MNVNIDRTVDFYFSIFRKKKLFSLFRGLEDDLLNQYNELKKTNIIEINVSQIFTLNVKTELYEESYDIIWSIPKALWLIHNNKINHTEICINHLYSDSSNLEKVKLEYYANKKIDSFTPIIISYYLPLKQLIVIDGNHRIYTASMRGNTKIKAYLLHPYYNSFIMNKMHYNLYSFHHNLFNLFQLCYDKSIWRLITNDSLDWNTYNGKIKFNYSVLKKIFLLMKQPNLLN